MDNSMQTLMQMMSMGNNPEAIVNNMIRQNPQMRAIFNQQKNSGMSMKDFTMQLAKQQGVDIEPMIQMLNQRGIK